MLIEVDDKQLAGFRQWLDSRDYAIIQEFNEVYPRQSGSRGIFVTPLEQHS